MHAIPETLGTYTCTSSGWRLVSAELQYIFLTYVLDTPPSIDWSAMLICLGEGTDSYAAPMLTVCIVTLMAPRDGSDGCKVP